MENLLEQFEICFDSPEDYLDGSVELKSSCVDLNEELFAYCHDTTGKFPTGPLCTLHTKGFDNEQIWEQIQLLNEPTIKFAKKKIKEISAMKISPVVTQSVEDGEAELLNEELSSEDENEECVDQLSDDANSSDVTAKQPTQTQDVFFNLAEMNRFLQDEDRKYENRLDSKQDGDSDVDLFREMSSEEEDNHLMYNDFFDPPNNDKDNSDDENDSEEENDENGCDEAMEDNEEMDDTQTLSSHQKQQLKVIKQFMSFVL